MRGSVGSDVYVPVQKAEPRLSLLQAAHRGDVNVAEVRARYGRGPHGPSYPAPYIEPLFGRTEEAPYTAEQLPAEFVCRGALIDQSKDLERKRSKPPKWSVAFLPPRRENTMYHAAADFSLRRGMALENMGLVDFRYVDYSWVSPWSRHSTFALRLHSEGVDPAAVYHQHINQILLMAPAKKKWDHPVTADNVRQARVDRSVVNYERHVDAMA